MNRTLIALLLALAPSAALADSMAWVAEPDWIEPVLRNEDGLDLLHLDRGAVIEIPGAPQIHCAHIALALPPDADPRTVTLRVVDVRRSLASEGDCVAPVRPPVGPDGDPVLDGLDLDAFGRDARYYESWQPFPRRVAEIVHAGRIRSVPFVVVAVAAAQNFPTRRHRLDRIEAVRFEVRFERIAGWEPPARRPASPTLRRALARFDNRADVPALYPFLTGRSGDAPAGFDYVIVTTEAIAAGSRGLAGFARHKESRGHRVHVQTVEAIDAAYDLPERADEIRQWLIDNHEAMGIEYVLLIGDPDPADARTPGDPVGSVPMKLAWPRSDSPKLRSAPTDFYYADLSSTWDVDGDGLVGEYRDDFQAGGMDMEAEVLVGRIPLDEPSGVDAALLKARDYELETDRDAAWRRSALLPMSWSNERTDGSRLGHQLVSEVLAPRGFATWEMYQHEAVSTGPSPIAADSIHPGDETLVAGAVEARWSARPAGLVFWWAHGSTVGATIGSKPTGWRGTLMNMEAARRSLDDDHPAFVFMGSCSNSKPEGPHLARALIKNGAVATVGASRVSWFRSDQRDFQGSSTNVGFGFAIAERLAAGQTFGEAIHRARGRLPYRASCWFANSLLFNLYGDPSLRLVTEIAE